MFRRNPYLNTCIRIEVFTEEMTWGPRFVFRINLGISGEMVEVDMGIGETRPWFDNIEARY